MVCGTHLLPTSISIAVAQNQEAIHERELIQHFRLQTHDICTVPLHTRKHWHLLVIHWEDGKTVHYNSLRHLGGSSGNNFVEQMAKRIQEHICSIRRVKNKPWDITHDKTTPQQRLGSNNCRVHIMRWTELLMKGRRIEEAEIGKDIHNLCECYVKKIPSSKYAIGNTI